MTISTPFPPPCLDAAQVDALLPCVDTANALSSMFGQLANGQAAQPSQTLTLFPGSGGDFIAYLGALEAERVFGVKLSPYVAAPGGAFVTAWTLLMSMDSGQPLLLCDSKTLTTERTAGTTALAVNLLAPATASVLCLVGSGPMALAHLRHLKGLRAWREIRVFSPRLTQGAHGSTFSAADARVLLCNDVASAVAGADVVALCTSAASPVIDIAAMQGPVLVTSISTNVPDAHEVAPGAVAGLDVYCDYRATTPASAGEMRLAARDHGWTADMVRGDLPGLVHGSAPPPQGDRPVFFRSIGLGLEDVAMAAALWRAHPASSGRVA
jgi:L-arginine dehydrogenase